jgi:hypothetical protein
MRFKDITGEKFGQLTAVKLVTSKGEKPKWECLCVCGKIVIVATSNLRSGNTKSCGCITSIKDITGQRFGRLVAIACTDKRYRHVSGTVFAIWECQCDCGNIAFISGNSLRTGNTRSCGCLAIEKATTHGKTRTRTYKSWQAMIQRCYNPKAPNYYLYGGQGVIVEDEPWLTSFETFYKDMSERPEGKTLDRYPDRNGNYKKSNCRWATPKEQAENRRPRTSTTITLDENPIIIEEED